eukprot:5114588-Ditylum_brightwellii.AAC.1
MEQTTLVILSVTTEERDNHRFSIEDADGNTLKKFRYCVPYGHAVLFKYFHGASEDVSVGTLNKIPKFAIE